MHSIKPYPSVLLRPGALCAGAALIFAGSASAESLESRAKRAIRSVFPAYTQGIAISKARCETGGWTDTYNDSSGAKGIFQVMESNDRRKLYDSHGRYVMRIDYGRLYDVLYSARVAFYMSKGGTDWHEWVC